MAARTKAARTDGRQGRARRPIRPARTPTCSGSSRTRSCATTCAPRSSHARKAYKRMQNGKGPAKALMEDSKLQKELRETADSLKEAGDQLRGKRQAVTAAASCSMLAILGGDRGTDPLRGRAQGRARPDLRRRGGVRVHLDDLSAGDGDDSGLAQPAQRVSRGRPRAPSFVRRRRLPPPWPTPSKSSSPPSATCSRSRTGAPMPQPARRPRRASTPTSGSSREGKVGGHDRDPELLPDPRRRELRRRPRRDDAGRAGDRRRCARAGSSRTRPR